MSRQSHDGLVGGDGTPALSVGDSILGIRPASSEGFGGEGGEVSGVMVMVISLPARDGVLRVVTVWKDCYCLIILVAMRGS
jgi:hypothetical protein